MDRKTLIGVGVLAAIAGFVLWKKNTSNSSNDGEDQTAADAAEAYYTQPPSVGIQNSPGNVVTNTNGTLNIQSRQAMPLPYNT